MVGVGRESVTEAYGAISVDWNDWNLKRVGDYEFITNEPLNH